MARQGPYFPDPRKDRAAAVRFINGPHDPGTAMMIGDTSEQMADALNRAFEAGRESKGAEIRAALGIEGQNS